MIYMLRVVRTDIRSGSSLTNQPSPCRYFSSVSSRQPAPSWMLWCLSLIFPAFPIFRPSTQFGQKENFEAAESCSGRSVDAFSLVGSSSSAFPAPAERHAKRCTSRRFAWIVEIRSARVLPTMTRWGASFNRHKSKYCCNIRVMPAEDGSSKTYENLLSPYGPTVLSVSPI